tara:strand:+ start:18999 stop:19271 length:273 start_codon:yes stop_codon:yes gene_type:complete
MAAVGDGADRFAARGALITTMLIVSLYSGMGVSPRIERMQREIGGSVAALPVDDARRGQFGRLHALSTALLVADGVGALVLMYWEARRGM